MMSLSPGMKAAQAAGYLSREDYYLKETDQALHSRWCGKGSESLDLSGPVRKEGLRAVCEGRHPATGELLVSPRLTRNKKTGEQVETRRAGNDCTLSDPKTVSVAYMLRVEGIKEAHDAAVRAVVGQVEKHYSLCRSHGEVVHGELVCAAFDHATSRNLDPQLHTHLFFINMARAPEAGWRANWPKTIFDDQKSLGLLYRQELAHQLQERGFEITIVNRSQMFFELKGVDPRLVEHFSSRRKEIEKQVALWKREGKFTRVPRGRLFEMAALETRDPKREVTRDDVVRAFERGLESCGTSAPQLKRELELSRDAAPERPRDLPEYSAPEVVRLAAERLVDREAVLDRARLLDQSVLVSGGGHSVRELNLAIDAGTDVVQRLGEEQGRAYYTTAGMLRLEARNLEMVKGLKEFHTLTTREEVAAYQKVWEEKQGVRLTDGQTEQVFNELLGTRGVLVTEGKPGTGKTLASRFIEDFNTDVLKPQGKDHETYNIAYTGKAALEMERASGRPGFSVDGFLNASARGEVPLQGEESTLPRLQAAGEKNLIYEAKQVVLRLDEAGMVGAKQAGHLLQIVKDIQDQGGEAKIHLVGDTRQMQAIQAGDFFHQVLELGEQGSVDVAHLNVINRQRDPGFLEIAKTLNLEERTPGENAREALAALDLRGDLIEKEQGVELLSAVREKYLFESGRLSPDHERGARGEKQSVLLITSTNADCKELNRQIREARIAAGEIEEGPKFRVLSPGPQGITADGYRPGEEVVFSGYRGDDGKMQRWGARLNTVGTVTGVDLQKNRVAVSYSFTARNKKGEDVFRTVTKKFTAAEMAGKTVVFREEERNFAEGDRVIALRNNKELGVRNGSLGVIKHLDETGKLQIDFGAGDITLDLDQYRHVDHAYAVTFHKSQGTTIEHSILFARVQPVGEKIKAVDGVSAPAEESYGRVSYNALNVAITRAQYGGCVFTNSVSGLLREVEHEDRKTSTLGRIPGEPERSLPAVPEPPMEKSTPEILAHPEPPLQGGLRTIGGAPEGNGLRRDLGGEQKDPLVREKIQERGGPGKESIVDHPAPENMQAVPGREKFDRGAKLGKRLDQLELAGKYAPGNLDDLLPKVIPGMTPVGKVIAKPTLPVAVKAMELEIKM